MKKYLLWLYNGFSYSEQEIALIGVFSDKEKAEEAKNKADKVIKDSFEKQKSAYTNAQPFETYEFGVTCGRKYGFNIETMEEDRLIKN